MIDISAYLDRIGLTGPVPPTLETLQRLTEAHVRAIPFENLSVLLGEPIDLRPEALQDKLVTRRRGGYCFEQNGYLLEILTELGFGATLLSGRVRYLQPRSFTPPRTHTFLRIDVDGTRWLADVGVGSASMTAPIRLDEDGRQETPHEPRRILREGAMAYNQVFFADQWHDVYEFTGEQMPLIDRTIASWWCSTHPDSHFRARLTVARSLPDGARMTILNRVVTTRLRDGEASARELQSPAELVEVLRTDFGVDLPPGSELSCPGLDWP